jgi:hypothetical protein
MLIPASFIDIMLGVSKIVDSDYLPHLLMKLRFNTLITLCPVGHGMCFIVV